MEGVFYFNSFAQGEVSEAWEVQFLKKERETRKGAACVSNEFFNSIVAIERKTVDVTESLFYPIPKTNSSLSPLICAIF